MATIAPSKSSNLRHFAAPVLRPVLEAEGELWKQRLHWDYHNSSKLLMQYLDSHMLPGYAAVEAGQIIGYVFCVYEETKAVIGDVFALSSRRPVSTPEGVLPMKFRPQGAKWRRRCSSISLKTLLNSPQLDRIESQLLLAPFGLPRRQSSPRPASGSTAGSSWCNRFAITGPRPAWSCLANWRCASGAKRT